MPNIIKLTVDGSEDLLNAGAYSAGALIRLQFAATEAGAYADVAGTGATPTTTIVAGTRIYTAFDPAGASSTWYRTRYENLAGTRVSDWSDPFQVSEEGSGLICSLYDVKQRLGIDASDTASDEDLLGFIGQVTAEIEGYTKRRFVRRPASGTATFLLDVEVAGGTIWIPSGLAEISLLEYANSSQPESGGTYTALAAADWYARPARRAVDEPITSIVLSDVGALARLEAGYNVLRVTGAEGYPRVPADIEGIGQAAVVRKWQARKAGGADLATIGPDGRSTVLRNISPAEMATLDRYRIPSIS